jgi:hypothetical protein
MKKKVFLRFSKIRRENEKFLHGNLGNRAGSFHPIAPSVAVLQEEAGCALIKYLNYRA